jgi:hypothetical protein
VEFYDTRVSSVLCNGHKTNLIVGQSAEEAFDRLRHQGLQDGVMDIVLAWEEPAGPPIRCVAEPIVAMLIVSLNYIQPRRTRALSRVG